MIYPIYPNYDPFLYSPHFNDLSEPMEEFCYCLGNALKSNNNYNLKFYKFAIVYKFELIYSINVC